MKKIHSIELFYFSGTGNARQIARWIAQHAEEEKIECQLHNIAKQTLPVCCPPQALIIIISPIHGFNYPKITLDFIRHFPTGKNSVVLMNTRAGMKIGKFVTPGLTGIAFLISSLWLKRKGYTLMGSIPFDMPSNWISLHPALNNNTVAYLHAKNYERVRHHNEKIFSGKRDFHSHRDIVQDVIISPIALAYYFIGRFIIAKTFYCSHLCNNCGICISQCPVKAIVTKNKRPFWTLKCESCMHCMNVCPERAIETSHGLLVVTSIFYSVLTGWIFRRSLPEIVSLEPINSLFQMLAFLGLIVLFYLFQHALLRYSMAAKLISLASLTRYKFWGRYKSIPDVMWKKKFSGIVGKPENN
ncbi:MAG: EFR1 family ferrodoxin [Bacteroidota bacterium]|nr:MAG: EFR1 family ferrodoxin [Bacteroidota bacterium]